MTASQQPIFALPFICRPRRDRKGRTLRGPRPLVASCEALLVLLRCHSQRAAKRAAQPLLVAETTFARHVLEPRGTFLDPTPGRVDPQPCDVMGGWTADPRSEQAREVTLAHVAPARQLLHGKIGIEMLEDPELEIAEAVVAPLCLEKLAELRLPAGTLDEHHELAGHRERRRFPPVLL